MVADFRSSQSAGAGDDAADARAAVAVDGADNGFVGAPLEAEQL